MVYLSKLILTYHIGVDDDDDDHGCFYRKFQSMGTKFLEEKCFFVVTFVLLCSLSIHKLLVEILKDIFKNRIIRCYFLLIE